MPAKPRASDPKKPAAKKPAAKKSVAGEARPTGKTKKAPAKPAAKKATAALREPPAALVKALKPLFLMTPSAPHTHWTLCLSDMDSPIELFEEEGHSGNGYAWDSVARIAMKGMPRAQVRTISFGSEAGTFVAYGEQLEPLVALGHALVALLRDEDALRKAIRAVPEDDWDD